MAKYCIDCGEILSGRADKKYCSDICRNAFNNKLNCNVNNYVRNINNVLRKNRRIFMDMMIEDKLTIHADKLLEKGFHFGYCTHINVTKKGDIYKFVYEFGYIQHNTNFVTVVLRRPAGDKVSDKLLMDPQMNNLN